MNLSFSGLTHRGMVRSENQDSIYLSRQGANFPHLFLVADGMGGANGGRTASSMAVDIFSRHFFDNWRHLGEEESIRLAVRKANAEIYAQSLKDDALHGMGTTLVGLVVLQSARALVVNIGDSRCYLFRGQCLRQISEDHSLVQEMKKSGKLTEKQARKHEMRNILSRALGVEPEASEDIFHVNDLQENDLFLLCSDGLHGPVSQEAMHRVLAQPHDIPQKVHELQTLAIENGGPDNISVVLVRVHGQALKEGAQETIGGENGEETTKTYAAPPERKNFFRRLFG